MISKLNIGIAAFIIVLLVMGFLWHEQFVPQSATSASRPNARGSSTPSRPVLPPKPEHKPPLSQPTQVQNAATNGLADAVVDHSVKAMEYMAQNKVHPGRRLLQEKMRKEAPEETFRHLVDNDNFAMLMPAMTGQPFAPGIYDSDVAIVTRMTRIRKLLEDAEKNPQVVQSFLRQQLADLVTQFPAQWEAFEKTLHDQPVSGTISSGLPDAIKTKLLCTSAVYVLSQIRTPESLEILSSLQKQISNGASRGIVDSRFLLYSMHSLITQMPSQASGSFSKNRDQYLEKVQSLKIPESRKEHVSTWNACYDESDFRRRLPRSKMDLEAQPKMVVEIFPSLKKVSESSLRSLASEITTITETR